MINSIRITNILKFLDSEYNTHLLDDNSEIPVLYAKMALLEYCGWLEQTFDEIARDCLQRMPEASASQKATLEKKIIKTHGFRYLQNVRPLLVFAIGEDKLSKIEKKLDATGDLTLLKSHLIDMSEGRNEAAHTFTPGTTRYFYAPSTTITYLNKNEPRLRKHGDLVCEE